MFTEIFNSLAACKLFIKFLFTACTGICGSIIGLYYYIIKFPSSGNLSDLFYAKIALGFGFFAFIVVVAFTKITLDRIAILDNKDKNEQDEDKEKQEKSENKLFHIKVEVIETGTILVKKKVSIDSELNNIAQSIAVIANSDNNGIGPNVKNVLKNISIKLQKIIDKNSDNEAAILEILDKIKDLNITDSPVSENTCNKQNKEE